MAGRPMPFGLFAGCTCGTVGASTVFQLEARHRYTRHTRLDHALLSRLAARVQEHADIGPYIVYRSATTLYESSGEWRFVRRISDRGHESLVPATLPSTPALDFVVGCSRGGATIEGLAEALASEYPEFAGSTAREYIRHLIDVQMLVSDLEPRLTTDDSFQDLISNVALIPSGGAIATELAAVAQALRAIDQHGLGCPTTSYQGITSVLSKVVPEVESTAAFHVELTKPGRICVASDLIEEIGQGVELLRLHAHPEPRDPLACFREAFVERYEGASVPLVHVIDGEHGIGFDMANRPEIAEGSILSGLPLSDNQSEMLIDLKLRNDFLVEQLEQCWRSHSVEIDITNLRPQSSGDAPELPPAFSVTCTIRHDAVHGYGALVRSVIGPSGARLLGRFCHSDRELHALVREHLRQEEATRPDAVYAEIVHLPEHRAGNVLSRPQLRSHEICIVGQGAAAPQRQIDINDLMVSVADGRIVLSSRRLGREVIPRLSAAHYYRDGLRVYHFLCALQSQGRAELLSWSWGAFTHAGFLPRVTCGRLVLSRARWRLAEQQLLTLKGMQLSEAIAELDAWRRNNAVPRWIVLLDGDMELPIDLDNVLSVEAFIDSIGRMASALVAEMWPTPDGLCVIGPEGRFTNEVVIPFVRRSSPVEDVPFSVTPGQTAAHDKKSDWLYVKIYAGPRSADWLLAARVDPLVKQLIQDGLVDRWFFVRFGESCLASSNQITLRYGAAALNPGSRADCCLQHAGRRGRLAYSV